MSVSHPHERQTNKKKTQTINPVWYFKQEIASESCYKWHFEAILLCYELGQAFLFRLGNDAKVYICLHFILFLISNNYETQFLIRHTWGAALSSLWEASVNSSDSQALVAVAHHNCHGVSSLGYLLIRVSQVFLYILDPYQSAWEAEFICRPHTVINACCCPFLTISWII